MALDIEGILQQRNEEWWSNELSYIQQFIANAVINAVVREQPTMVVIEPSK